jgi:phosphoglycerate kinase
MKHINFDKKKVLIRVDFNVPIDAEGKVTDDSRIVGALPTINYILEKGGSVILMSHLGRPLKKLKEDGSIDSKKFSLRQIIPVLEGLLSKKVEFIEDCLGQEAKAKTAKLEAGQVVLLENTRFYPGEEKGDQEMAKELASLGDIFINDAFGTAHRAHASTAVIAGYFDKEHKASGFLMDSELEGAKRVTENPERPFVAILGGAKVSDKILLIEKLATLADHIIIGGGMSYTFMRAKDGVTGNSLVEEDRIGLAISLLERTDFKAKFHFPVDSLCATAFNNDADTKIEPSHAISRDRMGLDIGPEAIEEFKKVILNAKTILWNGPMGVFEMPTFAQGTKSIALAVAQATQSGAFSLVGGGDSVAAINQLDLQDQVSYVSTGGGAMLELLEGKELPGVKALQV